MSNLKPRLFLVIFILLFYLMGCTQNPSENPFSIASEAKLPWSDLRLYDWLKDGMGGIKIVDGITGGSCCGWIDGEFYITVGNIRTAGENYIKSSNELLRGFTLMSIGLTLHERKHMDGFHHTSVLQRKTDLGLRLMM